MKKFVFLFCLIILIFFSIAFKHSTVNNFSLFGKTIILDPGHGGLDPGSTYKDEYEKDYNLKFARILKSILEENGATVIMTRDGDYDLSSPNTKHRKKSDFDNRIKLIDEIKPDLYLSLHMNYLNDSSYYGTQIFYYGNNKNIAEELQKEFNRYFKYSKTAQDIGDDKYMYSRIKTKGILIEYGFISNKKDRDNLKKIEYMEELSEIILEFLIAYFT